MEHVVTRESVLERVRQLPGDLLEEADMLLAELTPISDEEWLKILNEAPFDDEPLSLKEVMSLDAEHARRAERRLERAARSKKAV
jgi:hypothetical protein